MIKMDLKEDYLNSLKSWVKYSPWEYVSNYCDEQGRCWFQQYGKWILITPETAYNTVTCLPYHINPFETLEQPAQGKMKMSSIEDGITYRHKAYAIAMKAYRRANPDWEEQQRKDEEYAKQHMERSARAYKIAQEKLAKLEKEENEN